MRFAPEKFFNRVENLWHAGHAADENDLVDFAGFEPGILECLLARVDRALYEITHQHFKLGARQLHVEMFGATLVCSDKGQVDFCLGRTGQFDLSLLRFFFEALQSELIATQIDALLSFEFVAEIFDDSMIKILAAEEGIAVSRFYLKDAIADFQDRDVKGAAAKVVNGNCTG